MYCVRLVMISDDSGFNANTCNVIVHLHKQSKDIALGVDG